MRVCSEETRAAAFAKGCFLRIKILLFWEMMLGFGWKINKNIILAIANNLLQTVVVC
jgi:hypothetical protein